jgi:carboxylesterase
MKVLKVPSATVLQSPSQPFFLDGGTTGVLAIHGFTGVPGDMHYLAERLNTEGYTVSVPRLPGHGTNAVDFRSTNGNDWLRRCVDAYLDLSYHCEKVYVTGLSMGGVLTLLLATMFDIDRIALSAPAITTSNSMIRLTPILRWFMTHGAPREAEEYEDPGYRALAPEYWRYDWLAQVASLYKLQKTAQKRLARVRAKTLTIVSEKDSMVPVRAAEIIEKGLGSEVKRRLVLKESGHVVVNGKERESVADAIIEWFRDD